ncbi:MAG: phenylalanine--tRNA ligase subunit beta, partial [Rickettsiales bacterium]
MKFTLSWLKDHLDTSARLDELCATMTSIGLEVEEVKNPGDSLKDFVVGEILDAKPHPDADKLQCCKVSDGAQTLDIVCGAPNARKGLKVVLAREGVHIPAANFTIKKTKIRGAESCGMLCSVEELGIGEASDGILELPEDAKAGTPIVDVLGLDDPIIEIAITPDRGDCLGVRGIARDLAAAGMGMLKPLVVEDEQGNYPAKMTVSIEVEEDCPQFIGCEIKNVKNGPSPVWMQRRLMAIGLRPISALVDITNYISYNLGRPLHVYDMEKLDGGIVVRHAKDGETLEALNGKTYTLSEGMTVIADQKKVLGLGGIIGGEESGCVDETNDVFLEVALFNPINIAQTGRKLQIDSDARYRFERSVDPAGVAAGVEIAIRMITQLCGGEVSELVVAGHTPKWKRSIPFRPARVAELGGVEVSLEKMRHIFKHLGMQFEENGESWNVTPPSWRPDVEGEADLVEEVVRIFGYDNIPATPLPPVPE